MHPGDGPGERTDPLKVVRGVEIPDEFRDLEGWEVQFPGKLVGARAAHERARVQQGMTQVVPRAGVDVLARVLGGVTNERLEKGAEHLIHVDGDVQAVRGGVR